VPFFELFKRTIKWLQQLSFGLRFEESCRCVFPSTTSTKKDSTEKGQQKKREGYYNFFTHIKQNGWDGVMQLWRSFLLYNQMCCQMYLPTCALDRPLLRALLHVVPPHSTPLSRFIPPPFLNSCHHHVCLFCVCFFSLQEPFVFFFFAARYPQPSHPSSRWPRSTSSACTRRRTGC
jgi:hypothetical protein